jgi:hypothetical protein
MSSPLMPRSCLKQCSVQSNVAQPRDAAAVSSQLTIVCISTATSHGVGQGMYVAYFQGNLLDESGLISLLFEVSEETTHSTFGTSGALIAGSHFRRNSPDCAVKILRHQ